MNPQEEIENAVRNTILIFQRYAPWVAVAIVVVTILSISGRRRR